MQATMTWVAMRWELEEPIFINENVKAFPPDKIFCALSKKYAIFSVVCDLSKMGWPQRRERRIAIGVHKKLI
eukprot:980079-Pyramimonas_sp.AAC.1